MPSLKCPMKNCGVRRNTRKEINLHYVKKHKKLCECDVCNKKYYTPHSLQQHKYHHQKIPQDFTCTKCNITFPFFSQLKIHKLKHTRRPKYECSVCSELYKYKHDMQKHLQEHNAPIVKCRYCDYTGTKLRLSAHQKQHNPTTYIRCILCNDIFVHQMSYWRHQRICKCSGSPEF